MLFHKPIGTTAEFSLDIDSGHARLMCMGDKGWYQRVWLSRAEAIAAAKLLIEAAEAMPSTGRQPGTLYCSFCIKSQQEVRKLIAGPDNVFICDECATLCIQIVKEG